MHHLYKYRNINNKPIHEIEIVLARSVYGFRTANGCSVAFAQYKSS